jgi:hypothetical protein
MGPRRGRRAAKQRDELATLHHSITLSAMASTPAGIVNPSVFAVLRLTDDAVGCEPVSAGNYLLTGKITGNFAESGYRSRFSRLINAQIQ